MHSYSSLEAPSKTPVPGLLWPADRGIEVRRDDDCAPIVYIGANTLGSEDAIRSAGWIVRILATPADLLGVARTALPSCVVLDVSDSSPGDLAVHQRLAAARPEIPIICTVGDADLSIVVGVMKAGSFDVLAKPVADESLLDCIRGALEHSRTVIERDIAGRGLKDRHASLSLRERQVMALVVSGLLNKQVAAELGISEITVKAHRGRVMRKMEARTFAGLMKMAATLEL